MTAGKLKHVTFITEMDFWRSGSGCRARSLKLIEALSQSTALTVISTIPEQPADNILIKRLALGIKHFWLPMAPTDTETSQISNLRPFLVNEDVVIFRSLYNAHLREAAPSHTKTYIDVDDLSSEYLDSQQRAGIAGVTGKTIYEENKIYQLFDKIICIQNEHMEKLAAFHSANKLILAPHPISAICLPVAKRATRLGFLASGWHANTDGITWFLNNIWPTLKQYKITLDIYGYICGRVSTPVPDNVRLMGYVPTIEEFYKNIDIAINPVRYGSGIKIKTLEATGYGIPLVTTREGARGLQHLHEKSMFVCQSEQEFIESTLKLVNSLELREKMNRFGYRYVKENFNHKKCFDSLLSNINANV